MVSVVKDELQQAISQATARLGEIDETLEKEPFSFFFLGEKKTLDASLQKYRRLLSMVEEAEKKAGARQVVVTLSDPAMKHIMELGKAEEKAKEQSQLFSGHELPPRKRAFKDEPKHPAFKAFKQATRPFQDDGDSGPEPE